MTEDTNLSAILGAMNKVLVQKSYLRSQLKVCNEELMRLDSLLDLTLNMTPTSSENLESVLKENKSTIVNSENSY